MSASSLLVDGTLSDEQLAQLTQGLEPGMRHVPQEVEHHETFLKSWDGTQLFVQSWFDPEAPKRGRVALMHGYGEHSTRYIHVATSLARAGYATIALDARGHGKSEGKDAHVAVYDEYVLDLERLCDYIDQNFPQEEWGPLCVFGHSNGGLISMRYALRNPKRVLAFGVTSPLCGFKVEVPKWKEVMGNTMSKVWPTLSLPTELPPSLLSHRQDIVEQYAKDPLNKKIATARWFTETKSAQENLHKRAHEIQKPMLILSSAEDAVVDPSAAQACFEQMTDQGGAREFHLVPGAFHECLNEDDWATTLAKIITWFETYRTQQEANT